MYTHTEVNRHPQAEKRRTAIGASGARAPMARRGKN